MSIENEVLGNSRGGKFLGGVHLGSAAVPFQTKYNLSYCCIEFQIIVYDVHLYLDQCRVCRIGM